MTEPSPAVTISHPPEGLLRAINPIVHLFMRSPLAGGARKQLMVLNFTGRKTGRKFSVPLSAHQLDNALYTLTSAGWTANFRDGRTAEVLHDGKTTTMTGELIVDPDIVADISHRCAESYGPRKAQRLMGLKFRDNRTPTLAEFAECARRVGMRAVKLTPAGQ